MKNVLRKTLEKLGISDQVYTYPGKDKRVDCGTGHPREGVLEIVTQAFSEGAALYGSESNYGLPPGLEGTRDAVAAFCNRRYALGREKEAFGNTDVSIVENGTYAFNAILQANGRPPEGSAWLLPAPGYDAHAQSIRDAGYEVEFIETKPDNGFIPTKEQIEAAEKRCKDKGLNIHGLFITTPGNPNGGVITNSTLRDTVEALDGFCQRNKKAVLTLDEVYETLRHPDHKPLYRHLSEDSKAQTALILSASKMFGSAGLCGAVVSKCAELLKNVSNFVAKFSLSVHPAKQHAFGEGLKALNIEHDALKKKGLDPQKYGIQGSLTDIYANRQKFVVEVLKAIAGPDAEINPVPYEPEGALYVLARFEGLFKGMVVPDIMVTAADGEKSLRSIVGVGEDDGVIKEGKHVFNLLENLELTEVGQGVRFRAGELHGMPKEECWQRVTCTGNLHHLREGMRVLIKGLEFVGADINATKLNTLLESKFNEHIKQDIKLHKRHRERCAALESHVRNHYDNLEKELRKNHPEYFSKRLEEETAEEYFRDHPER